MINVYVWDMTPLKDPAGHASISVGKQYISWWPEHYRTDIGLGKVRDGSSLSWGGASYSNTMKEDKEHKGRNPDFCSVPISCLNEEAILKWWNGVRPKNKMCKQSYSKDENLHYDLARLSCATIVMRALLIGGAAEITKPSIPIVATAVKGLLRGVAGEAGRLLGEYAVGNAISPIDVKKYAEVIGSSINNKH